MPQGDPHAYAVEAFANLEKLATELASSGFDPNAIAVVSKMADTTRRFVNVLGKGQEQAGVEPEAPAPDSNSRPTLDSATADLHSAMQASAGRPRY